MLIYLHMEYQLLNLILILLIIVLFRAQINELSISTILIIVIIFVLSVKIVNYYKNKYVENMSVLSNEAIQNLSNIFNDGSLTVEKQYCINNNGSVKCIDWDFFNLNGTSPK